MIGILRLQGMLTVSLLAICMLSACSSDRQNHPAYDPPSEEEIQYAGSYGWHIQDIVGEHTYNIEELYPERLERMKSNGIDIDACSTGSIRSRTFSVAEKQKDGGTIGITLVYCADEGVMIGGSGGLENWSPGTFAIDDKQRMINDGIVEP